MLKFILSITIFHFILIFEWFQTNMKIFKLWKYAPNNLHRFEMMENRKLKIITHDCAMISKSKNILILNFKTFWIESFIGIETDEQTNKHHRPADELIKRMQRCRLVSFRVLIDTSKVLACFCSGSCRYKVQLSFYVYTGTQQHQPWLLASINICFISK